METLHASDLDAGRGHARRLISIAASLDPTRPILVGVGGPPGAGKSTLARDLSACVLSTDDYLPDYATLPEHQRDDPAHAHLDLLAEHLLLLRSREAPQTPIWCFHAHARIGHRTTHPSDIVVVEGIHALHATVRPTLDIAIFIDAPAHTRWQRWERIESQGDRGWGIDRARHYFHAVADPTFARHAPTYRAAAHLIITNDQS